MRRIAFIIFWVVLLPGLAWGHVRLEAASRLKTGFVDSLIYSYDQLNRLSNAVDSAVGTAIYGYDEVGNVKTTVYPSGVTNTYTYDALNRLTDLAGTTNNGTLASFKYKLGAAGNRTSLVETVKALNRTNNWFYDALYRLTNEVLIGAAPAGTNSYRYDAVGNRTNRTVVATGLTNQNFTYNTNDWLTGDVYDSNGSTRTNGPNIFFYDAENHLTNATVAGTAVAYTYTADGIRVSKTVGGTTTLYLVDDRNPSGYAQVLEELTVTGGTTNLAKVFTYGLDLIAQRDAGTGTRSFYGYDGNGNTRYLTGTNGAITDTYLYDAFGSLLASTGSTPNDYRYAGEQYDNTLGLYYLRARYLNAGTGRFWTRDSFAGNSQDPISLHKHLYVQANPVNNTDPSGLFTQRFGYLAEAAIQAVYIQDHPGDAVLLGEWSRFPGMFRMKPDMLNFTTGRWAEIKPLSPSGIIDAGFSLTKYAPFMTFGIYPDKAWAPSTHFAVAGTVPIAFFNAGGIIFYTDYLVQDFLEDVLAITTVTAARDYMARYSAQIASRTLLPSLVRISRLASTARMADGARFQQQFGIAAILAAGGAL